MSIVRFIIYTLIGSTIWNTVLVCVGAFAGNYKDVIINAIDSLSHVILILIIIVFIVGVYIFYRKIHTKTAVCRPVFSKNIDFFH